MEQSSPRDRSATGSSRVGLWWAGARPRTLPAAFAPVVVGAGCAAHDPDPVWWRALLALTVSVALQVGVNYANDYSDGVRGTDSDRVGPMRLVGSGAVPAAAVRRAAVVALAVAAFAGVVLAALTTWWLLVVGGAALVAAWTYTGGPRPYGYAGFGELFVFVFFGVVATVGTEYVIAETVTAAAVSASVAVGLMACALLAVNNLRDLPRDAVAGKRTLAVRLGDARARTALGLVFGAAAAAVVVSALFAGLTALFGLVLVPMTAPAWRAVRRGAAGSDLIGTLAVVGRAQAVFAAVFAVGLVLAG